MNFDMFIKKICSRFRVFVIKYLQGGPCSLNSLPHMHNSRLPEATPEQNVSQSVAPSESSVLFMKRRSDEFLIAGSEIINE